MSLLNLSCIFSVLVSRLFICDSILFSRFWIIFTIIIQNSLSGRFPISSSFFGLVGIYPVPLPAGYSSVTSSCLYYCVWGGLSVFWQFVEFSLLWSFLAVSGVLWVVCQGFLVRVFWWVELDFFSLKCNEVSSNELWNINRFGVTLGSLYIEAQGYVPGEFVWYVLLWNLLALGWCLVSV